MVPLDVQPSYRVSNLKWMIYQTEGIPIQEQKLMLSNRAVITSGTLADNAVEDGDTLIIERVRED